MTTSMVIQQGGNSIAVSPIDRDGNGDLCLRVQVVSNGFAGEVEVWADHEVLQAFCVQLTALNDHRRGEALLTGMSPNELEIRLCSVDALGHMAVSGFVGYDMLDDHASFHHRVCFGFEFDPMQLERVVRSELVKSGL